MSDSSNVVSGLFAGPSAKPFPDIEDTARRVQRAREADAQLTNPGGQPDIRELPAGERIKTDVRKGALGLGAGAAAAGARHYGGHVRDFDEIERLERDEGPESVGRYIDTLPRPSQRMTRAIEYWRRRGARPQLRQNYGGLATERAETSARRSAEAQALPANPVLTNVPQQVEQQGAWEAAKRVVRNPTSIGDLTLESAPMVGAGAAGMALAGPLGAFAAMVPMEGLYGLQTALDELGVDTTNPNAVYGAMTDPARQQEIGRIAATRGLVVPAVNSLGLLAVRGLQRLPARALDTRLARVGAQTGAEGGVGAGAEAAGMEASVGRVDPAEVLLEGLGEMGSTAVDIPATVAAEARQMGLRRAQAPGEPTQPAPAQLPPEVAEEAVGMGLRVIGQPARPMYIGPKAKTWDPALAAEAEQLEAGGAEPEEIMRRTGMHRGVGGEWRQEIADDEVVLDPQMARAEIIRRRRYEEGLPELSQEEMERRLANEEFEGEFELMTDQMMRLPISRVFEHPELYEAYPQLAELPFTVDPELDIGGALGGYYRKPEPGIGLARSTFQPDPEAGVIGPRTGVLLHELQHAVQDIETWPRGGSPGAAFNLQTKTFRDLQARRKLDRFNMGKRFMEKHLERFGVPVFLFDGGIWPADRNRNVANVVAAGAREMGRDITSDQVMKFYEGSRTLAKLQERDRQVRQEIETHPILQADPYEVYRRYAGEAEARDVEARRRLSPEQRQLRLPQWMTDPDEPAAEQQIVTRERSSFPDRYTPGVEQQWARWEPERTAEGRLKGAPEWVNRAKDRRRAFRRLTNQMETLAQEGREGRYWYEDSAREVLAAVNGDLPAAEKLIGLLAIYSPQATPASNTVFAVRALNQFLGGEPIRVKTAKQDEDAQQWLQSGRFWGGRKVGSFYLNLMHELTRGMADREILDTFEITPEILEDVRKATIDLWMLRAMGYRIDASRGDQGMGRYSFTENLVRKMTAELNQRLGPNEAPWEPHQIQAAIWTAIKARYEDPEVKRRTVERSLRRGHATRDPQTGRPVMPSSYGPTRQAHMGLWREEAMRLPAERAAENVGGAKGGFAEAIRRAQPTVTWEAIPAPETEHPILEAPPEERRRFTEQARQLLRDDQGDVLARMLDIPVIASQTGTGAYEGQLNTNVITRLLLDKPAKQLGDVNPEKARRYARAIQYVYQQAAVPWFRADDRADFQNSYMVVNPAGRVLRRFPDQQSAERFAEGKEGAEARGDRYALGIRFRFDRPLDEPAEQRFYEALRGQLGDDAGYTKLDPQNILVINFRDDETGLPFQDDNEFLAALERLMEGRDDLSIAAAERFGAEGQYGPVHDWAADPAGEALLVSEGLEGRPDLQQWLRGRRAAYEALLQGGPVAEAAGQPASNPEARRIAGEAVAQTVRQIAGAGAKSQVVRELQASETGEPSPARGAYLDGLISVALSGEFDPEETAAHESFHHLWVNALKPQHKRIISDQRPRLQSLVARRYPDVDEVSLSDEELAAHAFGAWWADQRENRQTSNLDSRLRRLYRQLSSTFDRLRDQLVERRFTSQEDQPVERIFERASRGGFARR